MCGIAGYIGRGDRAVLEKMTACLSHRGPDDRGFRVMDGAGFGFSRLSVIDLAGGRQPMTNEDGSVTIVFNGEIYNYRELKAELEKKGRPFRTASDTEVILRLYEEEGDRCFSRLWGMFAVVVRDERAGKIVAARDRLGKKPLYILRHAGGLVFGSEMKAILSHPAARRDLDLAAVSDYFGSGWLPAERTIFKDIEKFPPGHVGTWRDGAWSLKRYWSLEKAAAEDFPSVPDLGADAAADELERLASDAVKRRLVADVPVGVFLSGGVDSSLIAALAAEASSVPVKTFAIGFREASFDESSYALDVARRLGTDHETRVFGAEDALAALDELAPFIDEPFADPSILPTYLLSKATRERVTVALSGDGGDEAFWGYSTFKAHRVADALERLPAAVRGLITPDMIRKLPVSDRYMSLPFVAERFLRGLGLPPLERDRAWRAVVRRSAQARLFRPDVWSEIGRLPSPEPWWETAYADDPKKQLAASYLFDWLPDDILFKADRASMAASLEVRSPLLDHRIVEFAWRLRPELKLKGLTTKYLLKSLLKRRLPGKIVNRKKQGFALPTAAWLRGPLRDRMESFLTDRFIAEVGLFEAATLRRWWREHLGRERDHRACLWTYLMFAEWHRRWMP